jgi:hypothetical protein
MHSTALLQDIETLIKFGKMERYILMKAIML